VLRGGGAGEVTSWTLSIAVAAQVAAAKLGVAPARGLDDVGSDLQYNSDMAIRPELHHELLSLSPEDRHELADELYESLVAEPLDPAWERAWSREIDQRVEDIVAGRVELVNADEVHAELRAELRDARR